MPTYDYICNECEHTLDVWQRITDDALTKCPECNQNTLIRQIGVCNVLFTGTGFPGDEMKDKSRLNSKTLDKSKVNAKKNNNNTLH
jgi:putative FmdB family regulatory protein